MFTIFKRELVSYFHLPQAYVCLAVYLTLSVLFVFSFGRFMESNQANMLAFFMWQPWLLLFMVPAIGMRLWSEELRVGTGELLLTLPFSRCALVLGKFFAAYAFWAVAIISTLPMVAVVAWLGTPDMGMIFSGYLACFLLCGCYLAVSAAVSATTRDQLVSYVVSFAICLLMALLAVRPVSLLLIKWGASADLIRFISSFSVLSVFNTMLYGLIELRGILLMLIVICTALTINVHLLPSAIATLRARGRFVLVLCALLAMFGVNYWLRHDLHCFWDVTADKVHTLTDDSRSICQNLQDDLKLDLYFSLDYPELSNSQLAYVERIDNLLRQYAKASNGHLQYNLINPRAESEIADAEKAGCVPNIGSMGDAWFSSLVISTQGKSEVLNSLSPDGENILEYEISRGLLAVARQAFPRIGIISDLPLWGKIDTVHQKRLPCWRIYEELSRQFTMIPIRQSENNLPPDLDALIVAQVKKMPDALMDAIEEYLGGGGGVVWFCDPLCKADLIQDGRFVAAMPSWPSKLLDKYGIQCSAGKVLADELLATPMVSSYTGLQLQPTLVDANADCMTAEVPFLQRLASVKMFCAGELAVDDVPENLCAVPLIWSSVRSQMINGYEAQRTAADIMSEFKPDGNRHLLSIMLAGQFEPQSAKEGKLVLFADADMLHNSLCAQNQGENEEDILLSDNIVLLMNMMEYMSDSENLAGIRAKSSLQRPLERIHVLAVEAQRNVQTVLTDVRLEQLAIAEKLSLLKQGASPDDSEEVATALQREQDELNARNQVLEEESYRRQRAELMKLRLQVNRLEGQMVKINMIAPIFYALLGIASCIARKRQKYKRNRSEHSMQS